MHLQMLAQSNCTRIMNDQNHSPATGLSMIAKMSDNETIPFATLLPIQTIFDYIYTEVYIRFMI